MTLTVKSGACERKVRPSSQGCPLARLLAIRQNDDHAGLAAVVQHLGGPFDGLRQRRLARRTECVDDAHDRLRRMWRWPKIQRHVALIVSARAVGHQTDLTILRGARQNTAQRLTHFVDA
ncbi:hypothetical protein [Methyloceanibacter sp.]|uniref:hypothetical protein n=1 Tax=Methyloceanibacter sp. TaxID=1965321 RepID=UPI002D1FB8E1|nr:hypothetical protein [Methyloceanibacter sp.]